MSKYIALAAAVVILMSFVLQYPVEQRNHHNKSQFEVIVNSAKEEARQAGYFTPDIISRMKSNISKKFKIDESEIIVNATTTPKYRTNEFDERELIEYQVGVPIKKILATNTLWGVSDGDNQTIHYVSGAVPSEALSLEVEP